MAGLAQNTPLPTNIVVHQRSRELGVDFSDGSAFRFSFEFGIYSWDYLYQLGKDQDVLWKDYLAKLEARGLSRVGNAEPPPPKHHGGGCGGGGGCGSGGCGG